MATPVASAVPPSDGAQPFRFFDLSREIRDIVYDHLPKQCSLLHHDGFYFTIQDGPRLSLLCVSKHFGHEYTERVQRQAVLQIQRVKLFLDIEHPSYGVEKPSDFWRNYSTRLDIAVSFFCETPFCNHSTSSNCDVHKRTKDIISWLSGSSGQIGGVQDSRLLVNYRSFHMGDLNSQEVEALTVALDKIVLSVDSHALSCIKVHDGNSHNGYVHDDDELLEGWNPQAGWIWTC